jgi:hypothetical protein
MSDELVQISDISRWLYWPLPESFVTPLMEVYEQLLEIEDDNLFRQYYHLTRFIQELTAEVGRRTKQ